LEEAFLASSESWRGTQAAFSSTANEPGHLGWAGAMLGDLAVPDVRPTGLEIGPSSTYLAARNAIRDAVTNLRRTIAEVSLSEPQVVELVEKYVQAYQDWLSTEPEAATWTDCIAIHGSIRNVQAVEETPNERAGGAPRLAVTPTPAWLALQRAASA
jgi:hypothetical protein